MKRTILAVALLALLAAVFAVPVSASISIQGIYYDWDAAENESALTVVWTGRPAFEVKANEFQLDKKETTTAEVEARIQEKFNDLLVTDTKLSTMDAEDPTRQDPPILVWPYEEIVVIHNSDYLRTHKAFFAIHIYSLDDLETPESELNFLTRFSKYPIPDNWWE